MICQKKYHMNYLSKEEGVFAKGTTSYFTLRNIGVNVWNLGIPI